MTKQAAVMSDEVVAMAISVCPRRNHHPQRRIRSSGDGSDLEVGRLDADNSFAAARLC
ncbi:hypothetical protein L843_2102 [Mycobacterium intracellulare MIN_061107_1834]|nr:hypothetical protein L843_2102 [Mycobacterium intracellulare MIN_061107_1834]